MRDQAKRRASWLAYYFAHREVIREQRRARDAIRYASPEHKMRYNAKRNIRRCAARNGLTVAQLKEIVS